MNLLGVHEYMYNFYRYCSVQYQNFDSSFPVRTFIGKIVENTENQRNKAITVIYTVIRGNFDHVGLFSSLICYAKLTAFFILALLLKSGRNYPVLSVLLRRYGRNFLCKKVKDHRIKDDRIEKYGAYSIIISK